MVHKMNILASRSMVFNASNNNIMSESSHSPDVEAYRVSSKSCSVLPDDRLASDNRDPPQLPPMTEFEKRRNRTRTAADVRRLELKVEELRRRNECLEVQLDVMKRDWSDQTAIHEYAAIIREKEPSNVDSTYVLRLQSQLCKAMHKMGVLENQVKVIQSSSDAVSKSLSSELADLNNEKSRAELELLNDMCRMEKEKQELQDDYELTIQSQQDTIRALRKEVAMARAMGFEPTASSSHLDVPAIISTGDNTATKKSENDVTADDEESITLGDGNEDHIKDVDDDEEESDDEEEEDIMIHDAIHRGNHEDNSPQDRPMQRTESFSHFGRRSFSFLTLNANAEKETNEDNEKTGRRSGNASLFQSLQYASSKFLAQGSGSPPRAAPQRQQGFSRSKSFFDGGQTQNTNRLANSA